MYHVYIEGVGRESFSHSEYGTKMELELALRIIHGTEKRIEIDEEKDLIPNREREY